jgi:beta-barrel assembly-enhancing protease
MRLRFSLLAFCLVASLSFAQTLSVAPSTTGPAQQSAPKPDLKNSNNDRGMRDIDAIGVRNLGCARGVGNWYSLDRQMAIGKQYANQVEATSRLLKDPATLEYINRIGQNLVRNSDSQVPFTIKIIESDDVNAFALPGGYFYVDTGLILAADNEAELAGVMAHEIAHVAACHAARSRTRGQLMNMASLPLMLLGGPVAYAAYEGLAIATPLTYFKFSRKFEAEADFLGVQYMYKAGYDPQALTSFFEKVKAMEGRHENGVVKAFRTHPQTPERILKTQNEIATLLPAEAQYKVDSSDFQDVKDRLNKMEGALQIRNYNRPTLKRRISISVPNE